VAEAVPAGCAGLRRSAHTNPDRGESRIMAIEDKAKGEPAAQRPQQPQQGQPAGDVNFGVELIKLFAENENLADSDFHAFAEQLGMDVHAAEQAVYKLASIAARFILGGKFAESGLTYDDLDPEQLQMGIEIEQEHTPDIEIATKIAADHLTENPMYYSYLTEMEDMASQDMGGGEDMPAEEQGQVQSTGTNNNSETPSQS